MHSKHGGAVGDNTAVPLVGIKPTHSIHSRLDLDIARLNHRLSFHNSIENSGRLVLLVVGKNVKNNLYDLTVPFGERIILQTPCTASC